MQCEISSHGKYRVVEINEVLSTNSNLTDLVPIIEELLRENVLHIGIRFREGSFFTSRTGAIIINCWEMVRRKHGSLTLIEPGYDIRHFFLVLELHNEIPMVDSLEELEE